jgi:hypothetical protein
MPVGSIAYSAGKMTLTNNTPAVRRAKIVERANCFEEGSSIGDEF